MGRRIVPTLLALWTFASLEGRAARAQISLADDIIAAAAQGKENARQRERTGLGRSPGSTESPYRRSPGSTDAILGTDPHRPFRPQSTLTRRPADPTALPIPNPDTVPREHGLASSVERLPRPLPSDGSAPPPGGRPDDLEDEEGPPDGLDLDRAITRLIRSNPELRTKSLEIPQAEADVLTAGLRENPLLFYSSGSVPYGSYSKDRPGDITHGLSLVYPVNFSGKRASRVEVARKEKCILEAQFQNAVRLEIDNLYTAYVDVLTARQAVRAAERGRRLIDRLADDVSKRPTGDPADEESLDDLIIERDLAAMSVEDEQTRYRKARNRLAHLLALSADERESLEVRGSLRVLDPPPPQVNALVAIALAHRPDLIAQRLGIERAEAEMAQERAGRFGDAYLLYTPFEYQDYSQSGQLSSKTWGAGLFVSAPLFNRNQGNLKRARINVDQSHFELETVERLVIAEVEQAAADFANTRDDAIRLEQVTLPAVRRKRDRAWNRLRSGQIDEAAFLAIQRDSTALVRYHRDTLARHRRNTLKLNTVVGRRILP